MTIVTCNGCFDGLHPGHMFFLGFCRAQGDFLIVGINSDRYLREHKRQNFLPAEERKKALLELGFIEAVVIFDEEGPCRFISNVNPQVHCTGEEYRGRAVEEPLCREKGIRLVYVPRVGKWSSTALKGSGKYEQDISTLRGTG